MELTIGTWYHEPECSFDFSYRITDFVKKAMEECIMAPLGLIEDFPEKSLHVRVRTSAKQSQLEVKMGPFRENSTSVNCHLWFPYYAIVQAEKPLEAYVDYFIQAIPLLFKRWAVTEQQINTAATMIRTEIINNPYYELTPEEKSNLNAANKPTINILQAQDNTLPNTRLDWFRKIFGDN